MNPLKRSICLTAYFIAAIGLVFFLTDVPLNLSSSKAGAAIAIRDHVSDLEKNGSLLFTESYLHKKYEQSIYLTQNSGHDQDKAFVDSLTYLLKTNSTVDIYFLAHHNSYYELLLKVDTTLLPKIRLIYNTGCGNACDSYIYKALGADVYIAHQGKQSLSPIFYFYFLRRACTNTNDTNATQMANERVLRVLNFIGMDKDIKEHEGILF